MKPGHIFGKLGHIFRKPGHSYKKMGHFFWKSGHIFGKPGHIFGKPGHIFGNLGHINGSLAVTLFLNFWLISIVKQNSKLDSAVPLNNPCTEFAVFVLWAGDQKH